jgi:hypothetical protein
MLKELILSNDYCLYCRKWHDPSIRCSSVVSACLVADVRLADQDSADQSRLGDGLLGPAAVKQMLREVLGDHPAAKSGTYTLMLGYMQASPEQQMEFCAELKRDYGQVKAKATQPESHGGLSTSVHAIVRPLSFTGNSHQIQRVEALGCYFRVEPTSDGKQWRWGTFSQETRCFLYHLVDTREEAIACCNREWKRMLAPYLEV